MSTAGPGRNRGRSVKNFEERREFKRYEGRDNNIPFVAVRPAFTKIGALKDASLGGLGFKYALMEGQEPLSGKETLVNIDLFLSNNGFYLPGLKCKLAYDKLVENDSWSFTTGMQFRQCGLEFGEITQEQKEQIDVFLKHYTVGSA